MEVRKFIKGNRMAACTQAPWAVFIKPMDRPEILRQIRQECIDHYGYPLDECPKRLVCMKKKCLGRTLPYKSTTAKPYLKELEKTQEIRNGEMFIVSDCRKCPVVEGCRFPCNQITDFLERDKTMEPSITYNDYMENMNITTEPVESVKMTVVGSNIPWDIISERKQQVIRKYLYEGRDFRYIAETLGINNQASAKYEFYSALTKLSEYAIMRMFVEKSGSKLTKRQRLVMEMVYFKNLTQVETAKRLGVSKQAVQQTIARIVKKHNIKFNRFVKKNKKQSIYNVLEMFK